MAHMRAAGDQVGIVNPARLPDLAKLSGGKLRRLNVGLMVAEPPPAVPWVVEGLAVEGALTLLTGKPGEGKSLLATALAAGVAQGETVAGLACRLGRALVFDAENGKREIHRRVHTLGLPDHGVEVVEVDGWSLATGLDVLEQALACYCPSLLVLDSFRSLWPGGEENDSGAVAAVLDPLRNLIRRHDAAALLLHHSPKAGGEYRGSSGIAAAVELGFLLSRVVDDPEADRRSLSCFKCRPAPEPDRHWLCLAAERGLVLIDKATPPDEQQPPERKRDLLAPTLLAVVEQADNGPTSLADLCRAVGRSPKDSSVRRVLSDLQKNGEIEKTPAGYVRSTKRHGVTVPVAIGSMTPDTRPDCASPEAHAAHHGPHPTTKRVICWRCHPSAGRPV